MNRGKRGAEAWLRQLGRDVRRDRMLYLMILAPLAFLLVFSYAPMYGVQIAFRDYNIINGIWDSPWVGLKHIRKFFSSYMFWRLMKNTLALSAYSLAVFPLSLVLALLLNYMPNRRYKKTVQMVSYIPHFLSTVVMCGMVLQFLDQRTGMLNAFLGLFGVPAQSFMANPSAFPHVYIWSGVWQGVGYGSVIYIATLAGVSPELHEAAIIDGANIWQRIWHVDIPGVLPTFCILLIMRCGSIMNVDFEKILLLQNDLNGKVSEVISTYVYKQSFQNTFPQYSYSAAIGLFTSLVNMALLVTVNWASKRLSGNSLW
ncbi:MAG: ABC transporter permease subunit [Eubacteriales bacterium]|nr:ABC transporter permease subunit [Eubacteriales bacterium]